MKKRLFVAIDLPQTVKNKIVHFQKNLALKINANWISPDNMHLTLVFIGDTDYNQIPEILASLDNINLKKFRLFLDKINGFPSLDNPHSLWIGCLENKSLLILQKNIFDKLSRLGFTCDSKKFCPHITIARIKKKKNLKSLGDSNLSLEEFQVDQFALYDSTEGLAGRKHNIIKIFNLK